MKNHRFNSFSHNWIQICMQAMYWISSSIKWTEERQHGYFQKANATAHAADKFMGTILEASENIIISKEHWSAKSHNFSYYDYYLWGNLKWEQNNPFTTKAFLFNLGLLHLKYRNALPTQQSWLNTTLEFNVYHTCFISAIYSVCSINRGLMFFLLSWLSSSAY